MLSRAAARTTTSLVSRRGFHATRARMSSPYHYPEGPYTNIPFNPCSKWFGVGFWGFVFAGFSAPFGIAGAWFCLPADRSVTDWKCSVPDLQGAVSLFCEAGISGLAIEGIEKVLGEDCRGTPLDAGTIDRITVNKVSFVDPINICCRNLGTYRLCSL